MTNVKRMDELYSEHENSLQEIANRFNKSFLFPDKVIEDTTKRYLIDMVSGKKKSFSLNFLMKSIFVYIAVVLYLITSIVFYRKTKPLKSNVLFDIFGDNTFDKYYRQVFNYLDKEYKIDYFSEHRNKLFERRIAFKLLLFLLKNFIGIILLSIKGKFNYLDLVLRHSRKIGLYYTDTDGLTCDFLISARDNMFNSIRYFIYKTNGVGNILLIQGARRDAEKIAKSGDILCYNDYYYGYGRKLIDDMYGMVSPNKCAVGSIPLYNNTREKKEQIYDIVIVEEPVFNPTTTTSEEKFTIMINNICTFKKKYPQYKMYYTKKPKIHSEKQYISTYYNRLEKLGIDLKNENINNSYDAVNSSTLVIFQGSTVGLESAGLGKVVLHCNYLHYESHFDNDNCIFVITDESYETFESKLQFLLDKNNSKLVQEHLTEMKEDYMNLNEDPSKVIYLAIKNIMDQKGQEDA